MRLEKDCNIYVKRLEVIDCSATFGDKVFPPLPAVPASAIVSAATL